MGISPITSLTPLPLARAIERELEPAPMERVENSARTGDETYSPSNGKSARGSEGSEDDDSEEVFDDLPGEDEPESGNPAAVTNSTGQISVFA